MILLIAEKPSVAREHYQKLLERQEGEKFSNQDGYIRGQNYCITWAVGHLVTLAPFDQYEGYQGSWALKSLPLIPDQFRLQIIDRTQKQFHIVQNLLGQADTIINGADAGREGNLIFDLLLDINPTLKEKKVKRLWVNSFVEKDLDVAWGKLEENSHRKNLSYAARLRQRADWLVGLNATRAYTLTAGHGKLLSVGRVQTPTLNLVVERDSDVENFQELFYYGLEAVWSEYQFSWIAENKVSWVEEKAIATRLQSKVNNKKAELIEWKKSVKKSFPSKPFDLTDLQKDANKKLKMKAARTLEVAQVLYEKKLITYPRTDSAYLPDTMKMESYQLASKCCSERERKLMRPSTQNFVFVNSKKVTDHFAIIPTGSNMPSLGAEEMALYRLIRNRFVLAWLEPHVWNEASATLEVEETQFRTKFKVEIQKGYKSLFGDKKESGQDADSIAKTKSKKSDDYDDEKDEKDTWVTELPQWTEGDKAPLSDVKITEKKKSKPKYYTEGTLLTAMKAAGRSLEDEELAEAMKDRGLGTPATQAGIIETLKSREFIMEDKGHIMSTMKGRALIDSVQVNLKSAILTGEWEYKLKEVERGRLDPAKFYQETVSFVQDIFSNLKSDHSVDFEREDFDFDAKGFKCLKCESQLNRLNWGLKCSDESCEFKMGFAVAGRSLSIEETQQLLGGAKLSKLTGFKSKRGFDFVADLAFDENKELKLIFEEDPSRSFKETKHKCPACKSTTSENAKLIRCDQDRCPFTLWKTVASHPLSNKEISLLMKKKPTEMIEDFKSKKGSHFSAMLKFNSQFKVEFEFDNSRSNSRGNQSNEGAKSSAGQAQSLNSRNSTHLGHITCPTCADRVIETSNSFECARPQCGWKTPKTIASRSMSISEIQSILKNKTSPLLSGFKGKNSDGFDAKLILNPTHQIKFDLESIVKK